MLVKAIFHFLFRILSFVLVFATFFNTRKHTIPARFNIPLNVWYFADISSTLH